MLKHIPLLIAALGLAACGGDPKPKPKPAPVEEKPAEPKKATSKLLPWKIGAESDDVKQDGMKVTVMEEWLAERLSQPTQKLIAVETHERGARLSKLPGGTSLHGLGFQEGDIIVSVDKERPTPENALAMVLGALVIDQEIDVLVQRPGKGDDWVEGTVEIKLDQKAGAGHGDAFIKAGGKDTYRVAEEAARYALASGGHWKPAATKFTPEGDGVKLAGIGPKSILKSLGLNSGDTILTVNGEAAKSLNPAWATADKIVLSVKREDGKTDQLTYNLK
jgi:S1-C subfamily serine protease